MQVRKRKLRRFAESFDDENLPTQRRPLKRQKHENVTFRFCPHKSQIKFSQLFVLMFASKRTFDFLRWEWFEAIGRLEICYGRKFSEFAYLRLWPVFWRRSCSREKFRKPLCDEVYLQTVTKMKLQDLNKRTIQLYLANFWHLFWPHLCKKSELFPVNIHTVWENFHLWGI